MKIWHLNFRYFWLGALACPLYILLGNFTAKVGSRNQSYPESQLVGLAGTLILCSIYVAIDGFGKHRAAIFSGTVGAHASFVFFMLLSASSSDFDYITHGVQATLMVPAFYWAFRSISARVPGKSTSAPDEEPGNPDAR